MSRYRTPLVRFVPAVVHLHSSLELKGHNDFNFIYFLLHSADIRMHIAALPATPVVTGNTQGNLESIALAILY